MTRLFLVAGLAAGLLWAYGAALVMDCAYRGAWWGG